MHLYAAAARYQRGQIQGGDGGQTLATAARAELVALGARNPERIADMVVPGVGASR
jgi:hypothetical protein